MSATFYNIRYKRALHCTPSSCIGGTLGICWLQCVGHQ